MTKLKPDAWMPLYIGDWDASTRHLTCEQDGAYGRIVRAYWKNGPPPDDEGVLSRIVGVGIKKWRTLRAALAPFFNIEEGLWRHRRVDALLAIQSEKRQRAVARSQAGNARRWPAGRVAGAILEGIPQGVLAGVLRDSPSASASAARASGEALARRRRGSRGRPAASPPPRQPADRAWTGPPEIRELVTARYGEAYARSWLDGCAWEDGAEPRLIARTGLAADRLRRDLRREWLERGIAVERAA